MTTPLAGHTNSHHTYTLDEALAGIAEAGYADVELSAVSGWTEHVVLDDDRDELRAKLAEVTRAMTSAHRHLTSLGVS